jgi:dTDP-4-amino-4,6-dideoxygalactose transaminase
MSLATQETQPLKESADSYSNETFAVKPPPIKDSKIPYHEPVLLGTELSHVRSAVLKPGLAGGGEFSDRVIQWLESETERSRVFLTNSGTRSLEMAALLCDLQPGDEVIAPSYTFVSTINAFLLRGARVVFIDIDRHTMNIDHRLIEAAITDRTRVIVPVHYAAIGCDMDPIMEIARKHNLLVVEDAAQCPTATYKGKPLGSIGHIGCMSFHATKNFTSGGQGGAVFVNDPSLYERADIVYDNGTNRRAFFRGEVSSYEWQDLGSNFFLSEVQAAYLWGQLDQALQVSSRRHAIWDAYYEQLQPLTRAGHLELMCVPPERAHNAHIFFLKLADQEQRDAFGQFLKEKGISAATHYTTLHDRAIAKKLGCRFHGEDQWTTSESLRLTRLPLFYSQTDEEVQRVIQAVFLFFDRGSEGSGNRVVHQNGPKNVYETNRV